jgi:hypothetical protein
MAVRSGTQLEFHALGRRAEVGNFDGGAISSDAGGLLLEEVEAHTGILARLAAQFIGYRDPELIEHNVRDERRGDWAGQVQGLRQDPQMLQAAS